MEIALQTCLEMLRIRSCTILEIEDEKILATTRDGDDIIVIFSNVAKLNINVIKEYIKVIEELQINRVIIVFSGVITSSAKKVIENLFHIKIELFSNQELLFNITTHKLYRPHTQVVEPELSLLKKKYGVKLPILLRTDPVARFHGFEKGDLIKITRKEGFISYRYVK